MKSAVRRMSVVALGVLLVLGGLSGGALTQSQSQSQTVTVQLNFRNVCEQGTITIQQIAFTAGRSLDLSLVSIPIGPGQTAEFSRELSFVPERLAVSGTLDGRTFNVEFQPLPTGQPVRDQGEVGGCLEVFAVLEGAGTQPPSQPPTGQKPIFEGQSLQQVLGLLQAQGFQIRQEGSQANPKLRDLSDPMFLRAIPGFSVQVVWVGAPGTLRSVITWDNPAVDLDLLVFGFGACFQLTPPGVLAELCDRAPSAPVPGVVFAVVIINWSPLPQAYVLSLSP